ncbi:MAG: hypothetical protein JNL79_15470 [Myxococcales bacterium]|nr:hypothetical protein [Myxococcales bacterium]
MSQVMQHVLVVGLALACLVTLVVRRVRALQGRGPACDGCAKGCSSEPLEGDGRRLVPPEALVRRAPRSSV